MNEQKQPKCFSKIDILQNSFSTDCQDENLWKIPVKKLNFSKVANLQPPRTVKTGHFHMDILIPLALI